MTLATIEKSSGNSTVIEEEQKSTQYKKSPTLSHRGLTTLLSVMCIVPVLTIIALFQYLPTTHEGQLNASASAIDLPPADFYAVEYYKRPPYEKGQLQITNESDQDWTNLNIQVNKHYQIYDVEPIPAGETKTYDLNRFLSRTGARFSLQYNELKMVRVYARLPTKDRATFFHEFETTAND
jgi:hypothetical protein